MRAHYILLYMAFEWIAGLGSVAGSLINAYSNKKNTERTNDVNKELQENANAFSEKMWNQSNEYNDPSAVVQRARNAGINPNSVLSGGVTAQASPMSGATASAVPYPEFGNVIGEAIANALTFEQARGQSQENKVRPEQLQLALEQTKQQIETLRAQGRLSHQQAVNIQFEMDKWSDVFKGKTEAEIKLINAQVLNAIQQNELLKHQGKQVSLQNQVNEVVSDLAKKYGIVVNGSNMTALITALMSPNSKNIVSDFISNLFSASIDGISNGVSNVIKTHFNPLSKKKKRK